MSRLDVLTIAIVILCLAALGFLVYKIVDLSNPPEGEQTETVVDPMTYEEDTQGSDYYDVDEEANANGDVDLDDDELGSTDLDETTTNYDDSSSTDYDEDEMDTADDTSIAETDFENEATNDTSSDQDTRSSATSYSSGSEGRYMVQAGTFRQQANADRLVSRLRKLGYSSARSHIFDGGAYAVVVVNRFSSYNSAKALVSELNGKGIDALVAEKR